MDTLIDWGNPRYLDLPDLRMAIFEAGSARDDRPSIILCHGFPEIAYSWRLIVGPLVEAGFHVVAPDLRGFGFTGAPLDDPCDARGVPLYDMVHLCADLANLLDALALEKAVFVGHDWGGIVMWQLSFYQPDHIAGLIGVNTPFIPRLSNDPIEMFRNARGDDFYICAFQDYGIAEAQMDADVGHTLRGFYRKGGGDNRSRDASRLDIAQGPEWENFALLKILARPESSWPGVELFDATDFTIYESAFTRSGFRGGINWYRNFTHNWHSSAEFEQKITQPSLMICAENDTALPPIMAEGMSKYVTDLETHLIKGCGHWTQNEKPEELAALMCDWLRRRFA